MVEVQPCTNDWQDWEGCLDQPTVPGKHNGCPGSKCTKLNDTPLHYHNIDLRELQEAVVDAELAEGSVCFLVASQQHMSWKFFHSST